MFRFAYRRNREPSVFVPKLPNERKLRHEKISFGRQGDSTQTKTVETL